MVIFVIIIKCYRYEAWGMPVLEAMASGLAVVTTRCYGVTHFAEHGRNCLMADPGDHLGMPSPVF